MSYEQLMRHAADIRDRAAVEMIKEQRLPPFDRTGNPRTAEERNDAFAASRRTVLAQGPAEIPELFQPFAEAPDPARFEPMCDRADGLAAALSTGLGATDQFDRRTYLARREFAEIADVRTALERWHGPAAEEFRKNFLTPFPDLVDNQFIMALLIRGALEAEREIWINARTDIDQIAHNTLHALDALDDCTKFEWTMTFTVLAAVAAVAAVPVSASAGVALFVTVIGASSQVVAGVAPEDPPKAEYGARTVDGVLDNMREAIARVKAGIHEQETTIADALTAATDLMRANRPSFVAPRPALTAATRSTIQEELGDAY